MAYEDFKDLKIRTFSDNILRDKAFNIAKNHKYDGYQRGIASIVYKFFDKKLAPVTDKYLWQAVVLLKMRLNKIFN